MDADDGGLPLEPVESPAAARSRPDQPWWDEKSTRARERSGRVVGRGVVQPDLNLQCSGCGYALTGVSMAGRCPECGQRVERSMRDARLASTTINGKAVAAIVLGALSLATAGCLSPVAIVVAVLALRESNQKATSSASRPLAWTGLAVALLPLAIWLVWVVGLTISSP